MSTQQLNYFGLFLLLIHTVVFAEPLVYTRQPRVAEEFANWQHWYDVGQPNRFTESDLVLDDLRGSVKVIHDCTASKTICAAHDGRVSPDGLRVAYTVAYRDTLYPVRTWGTTTETPAIEFKATKYEVWIYDVTAGISRLVEGDARMPDWRNNSTLVFASSRDNTYPAWAYHGNDFFDARELHLFSGVVTTDKLTAIKPEWSHGFAMNPVTLSNGWLCASVYNGFGPRQLGTPANHWWVECSEGNGTNHRAILNAHSSPTYKTSVYLTGIVDPKRRGTGTTQLRASRPLSEIKRGKLAVGNYYRSNHQGALGIIFGLNLPGDAEGCSQTANIPESDYHSTAAGSGRFTPCDIRALTPFGTDGDDFHRFDLAGKPMGKAGYAAASPNAEYLLTICNGMCYEGTMPAEATRTAMGGEPTSHRFIAEALVPVVTNWRDPKQVRILVSDERYNTFDARYVVPYQTLYGIPEPAAAPAPLTGTTTTLNVVNARIGELDKLDKILGTQYREYMDCGLQGCADRDYATKVTAIRITQIIPWRTVATRQGFSDTKLIGVFQLQPDGSVSMQFRCGINYQLDGVDATGASVAKDNSIHQANCGETVTCWGCHENHSSEKASQLKATPQEAFAKTLAASKPPTPGC